MLQKSRFEIGLILLDVKISRFPFSKRGFTKAVLKSVGKTPSCREWFTMTRMSSDTELKIVLKRKVEIGSREHVEGFSSVTIFLRVTASTRSKRSSLT